MTWVQWNLLGRWEADSISYWLTRVYSDKPPRNWRRAPNLIATFLRFVIAILLFAFLLILRGVYSGCPRVNGLVYPKLHFVALYGPELVKSDWSTCARSTAIATLDDYATSGSTDVMQFNSWKRFIVSCNKWCFNVMRATVHQASH